MSAIIEMPTGDKATITDYKWSSDNKVLEQALNLMLDPDGSSGSDPNPDHTAAMQIVKEFGAELLSFDEVEYDPMTIY